MRAILYDVGISTRDGALYLASLLKEQPAPGLFACALLLLLVVLLVWLGAVVRRRLQLLDRARLLTRRYSGVTGFHDNLDEIAEVLDSWKGADAEHLAETWKEFKETTVTTRSDGAKSVRNSIRPSFFFNLEEMGFSVSGWRFVPGLFVSIGLAATFLGLIAALQQTGDSLQAGGDQAKVTEALTQLLTIASAKFIMSLTGLVCSIAFTVVLRVAGNKLETAMRKLTHELEIRMEYLSLEDLAEQQLHAVLEQRDHMRKLNDELIAAITEPLQRAADSGASQVGEMVENLAGSLSSGLVSAMSITSDRLDSASEKLSGLAREISGAAENFSSAAERAASGLDVSAGRLEVVSDNLTKAGTGLASAAGPIAEAAEKTAIATQSIAASSIDMVESARATMVSEKDIIVSTAATIRDQIKSFESRAAAYDGQLERAFKTFAEEISRSISEVENHANTVHEQYADALGTLQAVIENAKAFEPESARPMA